MIREELAAEHAADKQAAVDKAVDEMNAVLAQTRVDFATEKAAAEEHLAESVSKAVEETVEAVTARLEATHSLEKQELAERQKAFNITFKRLMQQLVDQPDKLAAQGMMASPSANLAIKYESL